MRHLTSTSLPIANLVQSSLDVLKIIKEVKTDDLDNCKAKESGLFDKLWRKNIKVPEAPKVSLKRSLSSVTKSKPNKDEQFEEDNNKRSNSKKSSISSPFPLGANLSQKKADEFADTIINSLKAALKNKIGGEIELPEYGAGEVTLDHGKVSGICNISRGGEASLGSRTDVLILSFPLVVRDIKACYSVKGRIVKGDLVCSYHKVSFNVKLSQRVGTEVGTCPQLVELSLSCVEGVKMDVSGFGPLNWIAAKKITDLIQETVLQEVEDEFKCLLQYQLAHLAFYFQIVEQVSPNLTPVGIIVQ